MLSKVTSQNFYRHPRLPNGITLHGNLLLPKVVLVCFVILTP